MLGVKGGKVKAIRRGKLDGFELVGEGVGFCKLDAASLPGIRRAIDQDTPSRGAIRVDARGSGV